MQKGHQEREYGEGVARVKVGGQWGQGGGGRSIKAKKARVGGWDQMGRREVALGVGSRGGGGQGRTKRKDSHFRELRERGGTGAGRPGGRRGGGGGLEKRRDQPTRRKLEVTKRKGVCTGSAGIDLESSREGAKG